jgi:hypothetical protein
MVPDEPPPAVPAEDDVPLVEPLPDPIVPPALPGPLIVLEPVPPAVLPPVVVSTPVAADVVTPVVPEVSEFPRVPFMHPVMPTQSPAAARTTSAFLAAFMLFVIWCERSCDPDRVRSPRRAALPVAPY